MPLALAGYVTDKTQLAEKHSGVDDVYMLVLDGRRRLQVDPPIFAAVETGSRLEKAAWSRTLRVDDRELEIHFSADFWGMLVVMPAVWLTCIFLARGASGSSEQHRQVE